MVNEYVMPSIEISNDIGINIIGQSPNETPIKPAGPNIGDDE